MLEKTNCLSECFNKTKKHWRLINKNDSFKPKKLSNENTGCKRCTNELLKLLGINYKLMFQ